MTNNEFLKLVKDNDLIGFKLIDVNRIIWTISKEYDKNEFILLGSNSEYFRFFNIFSCWRYKLYESRSFEL